jgi:hypothetical protein
VEIRGEAVTLSMSPRSAIVITTNEGPWPTGAAPPNGGRDAPQD